MQCAVLGSRWRRQLQQLLLQLALTLTMLLLGSRVTASLLLLVLAGLMVLMELAMRARTMTRTYLR